jgi:hypothetical protein
MLPKGLPVVSKNQSKVSQGRCPVPFRFPKTPTLELAARMAPIAAANWLACTYALFGGWHTTSGPNVNAGIGV